MKIRTDVENGKSVSISDYFDDLLSDDERFERGMERMFARLDASIARGEVKTN